MLNPDQSYNPINRTTASTASSDDPYLEKSVMVPKGREARRGHHDSRYISTTAILSSNVKIPCLLPTDAICSYMGDVAVYSVNSSLGC